MSEPTRCRGCGAMIVFIRTPQNNAMPCQEKRISVVTAEGRVVQGHEPHWGYCSAHKSYRIPKPKPLNAANATTREEGRELLRKIREDINGADTDGANPGDDET